MGTLSYRPLSSVELDEEVWRISQKLDHQVGETAMRAKAAADAEVKHKIAFAQSILQQEGGTVAEREAKALLECRETYALHKGADAVLLAAQEAGRSLRAQADMLRSLYSAQKAAITYAHGEGG